MFRICLRGNVYYPNGGLFGYYLPFVVQLLRKLCRFDNL